MSLVRRKPCESVALAELDESVASWLQLTSELFVALSWMRWWW